jgi:hypothetical protein
MPLTGAICFGGVCVDGNTYGVVTLGSVDGRIDVEIGHDSRLERPGGALPMCTLSSVG